MKALTTELEVSLRTKLANAGIEACVAIDFSLPGQICLPSNLSLSKKIVGFIGFQNVSQPQLFVSLSPAKRDRQRALKWCDSAVGAEHVAEFMRAHVGIQLEWCLIYKIPFRRDDQWRIAPKLDMARLGFTRPSGSPASEKEKKVSSQSHIDSLTKSRLQWLQSKCLIDPDTQPELYQEFLEFDGHLSCNERVAGDVITAQMWNGLVSRIRALENLIDGSACSAPSEKNQTVFRTGKENR